MKKALIWICMMMVAVIFIPLSFMLSMNVAFNDVVNAFFATSHTTLAFLLLQIVLMMILSEVMIESEKTMELDHLKWLAVALVFAVIVTKGYLYYVVLAIISGGYWIVLQREKNKLKDEITEIIEDVKQEYMD